MVETGSIFTVNYVKDDSQWATVTYVISGGHGSITSGRTSYEVLKGTKWSEAGITDPTTTADSGYKFNGWTGKVDTIEKNVTVIGTFSRIGGNHPRPKPTVTIEDDDALGLNTTDHFAYIVGYGNGEVRPQNNITRAEVATIFFRLLTDDVRDENLTKTNRYSDVAATSWYNTAVSTLSSMGIITGYPDGTFRPNAAITRAEFAAIAARFDHDGDKTAAKFSDIANHWAKDEISIAYNNGWITGYPDGTFGPQRDITRAETMTLVNRVLNRQPETEDDLLPNMTVWTDNANPNAWYYLAVQEATNSHYYKFKTNSKYEKWTELRETRDWTQLEK
jgi:Ig-like, group 2